MRSTDYFGTRTGTHAHPVTHPSWLTFTDGACVVCAGYARLASNDLAEHIRYLMERGNSAGQIQTAFNDALKRVALETGN